MPTPHAQKLPLSFDAARLQADLDVFEEEEWIAHFVRRNYDGSWSVIPLRGPAGETHPIRMSYSDPSCDTFEDTPFLDRTPYLREVLGAFECPLLSVRLMRLAPGSVIKEHTDFDLSIEDGTARLHVPIQTNPDVDFRLCGERMPLHAGECWYLKLSEPHSVRNDGSEPRVHLVLDVTVNSWLAELVSG